LAGGGKNSVENEVKVDLDPCTRCLFFKKISGEDRDGALFYCDVGMKAVLRSLRKYLIKLIRSLTS